MSGILIAMSDQIQKESVLYSVLCILLSLEIAGASPDSILKHESLEQ